MTMCETVLVGIVSVARLRLGCVVLVLAAVVAMHVVTPVISHPHAEGSRLVAGEPVDAAPAVSSAHSHSCANCTLALRAHVNGSGRAVNSALLCVPSGATQMIECPEPPVPRMNARAT
jgi:hypothetical protein